MIHSGFIRVPIERHGEPIDPVDIELDLCPGMVPLVCTVQPFARTDLVVVILNWLVKQPFAYQTAHPARHVVLKAADEGRHVEQ